MVIEARCADVFSLADGDCAYCTSLRVRKERSRLFEVRARADKACASVLAARQCIT